MELRCPDPSCNPYLTLAACLVAGLDGIERQRTPPAEITENIFAMSPEEREAHGVHNLPGSLHNAVTEMLQDELVCETLTSISSGSMWSARCANGTPSARM